MVTVLADGPTELYRQLPSTVGRPHAAIPLPLSPLARRFRRKTFEMQILNCRSAATLLVVRKHAETISTAPMNPILDLLPLLYTPWESCLGPAPDHSFPAVRDKIIDDSCLGVVYI